jgi:hypothetical protein
VRVRGRVNGVNELWGSACRLKIDAVAAACPTTQLRNDPSASFISCGATGLERNGTSHITAVPVTSYTPTATVQANRYRFKFENQATLSVFTITQPSYPMTITPQMPFQYGATYNVQVQASFNGGNTWCPYGAVCTISFRSGPGGNSVVRDLTIDGSDVNAELLLWPNPNHEGTVYVRMSGLPEGEGTANIDVYNAMGQLMHSERVAKAGTELNHVMDLQGSLPAGMYLVNITVDEHTFITRLVMD